MLGLYWESPETFKSELINLRVHGESKAACIQSETFTPGAIFSHLDADEQARKSSEDTHLTGYTRFEKVFGLGKLWVKKVFWVKNVFPVKKVFPVKIVFLGPKKI